MDKYELFLELYMVNGIGIVLRLHAHCTVFPVHRSPFSHQSSLLGSFIRKEVRCVKLDPGLIRVNRQPTTTPTLLHPDIHPQMHFITRCTEYNIWIENIVGSRRNQLNACLFAVPVDAEIIVVSIWSRRKFFQEGSQTLARFL